MVSRILILTFALLCAAPMPVRAQPPDTLRLTAQDTVQSDSLASKAEGARLDRTPDAASAAKLGVLVLWLVGGAVLIGWLALKDAEF